MLTNSRFQSVRFVRYGAQELAAASDSLLFGTIGDTGRIERHVIPLMGIVLERHVAQEAEIEIARQVSGATQVEAARPRVPLVGVRSAQDKFRTYVVLNQAHSELLELRHPVGIGRGPD